MALAYHGAAPPPPAVQELDDAGNIAALIELTSAQQETIRSLGAVRAEYERIAEDHRTLRLILAHELRTPLTAVLGVLDTLGMPNLPDDDAARLLASARRQAGHLHELVEDLLDVQDGRVVEGHRSNLELVSVSEIIADACTAVAHRVDQRRITVSVSADLDAVTSPPRLRRLLVNLLVNAAKYAGADTPIDINAVRTGGMLRLEVMDRGPGVAPDVAEALFQPFEQGTLGTPDSGLGLGLYVVRTMTRSLGGEVRLLPRDGGGTIARVLLPQQRRDDPPPPTREPAVDDELRPLAG